jgi:hypothetical protein
MNGPDQPSDPQEPQIQAVMRGVLDYLEVHPNASDTRRGVEFWLRGMPETPSPEIVEMALERLVRQSAIEMRRVAGGAAVFGLAQGRQSSQCDRCPRENGTSN